MQEYVPMLTDALNMFIFLAAELSILFIVIRAFSPFSKENAHELQKIRIIFDQSDTLPESDLSKFSSAGTPTTTQIKEDCMSAHFMLFSSVRSLLPPERRAIAPTDTQTAQ